MNRVALITGGSSGIGKCLAECFGKDGWDLVLVSANEEKLISAAEYLSTARADIQVLPLVKDLTHDNAAQEIYDVLYKEGIFVEALVNDAGVGQWGGFAETSLNKDVYIIRLNIEALIKMTKLFLQPMMSHERGAILNVGSIAGFQPGPLLAVYHATKAFVNSFSDAIAEELKDTGITVTCLCPGATATDFFERADMEETKMVQSGFLMDPMEVAKEGYAAFKDGERVFIPGMANKVLTFMRRVMPKSAQAKLSKKMYELVEERVSM